LHYNVDQKICAHLLQLSQSGLLIRQSPSYLAELVGCTRQSINRQLGVLAKLQIIAKDPDGARVLNQAALKTRIQQLGR
jgi:CRP/FNR family cyclic AMP-dependent transcriptional regulator